VLTERGIRFGRYHFHPTQGLTRGRHDVHLTPKSLGVLRVLLERSGEVVTREELFSHVWPDTSVSDAALTTCIQELRRALADDARDPKYIETLHRRGFRFLAAPSVDDPPARVDAGSPASSAVLGPIVGRETALAQLARACGFAREGRRQVWFITGEPGIGKTALVNAAVSGIADESTCRVVRAECVEHHGAGEAYQPLLEALTRLCTQPGGEPYRGALRQCAPTWMAQLPALQTPAERIALRRRTSGATPERMLRELTDAIEAMARRSPIVLCLEDLHWSDASTLDWIASFGRRPEPAAVLVIGTYRPGEGGHRSRSPEALAQDLGVRGLCGEIALSRLDVHAVTRYVTTRFPSVGGASPLLERLAALVHERTEGNPLFVVNALADLVARHVLVARDAEWLVSADLDATSLAIPDDVRRTIERQIDRLDDTERGLLEVASVAGSPCAAAAVAAGADVAASAVEAVCDGLARRQAFVRTGPTVEWPDGTLSATFEFLHSLYREVLSARLSPSRRVEVHRRIAMRLEAAHGERARELAVELAVHFEEARDYPRAVAYLQQAAETDRSRSAHDAARRRYQQGLALLERLPAGDARDEREVALRIGLGHVLMQTRGWGAPEVEAAYARVRELSEARGEARPLLPALWNLWIFSITRGDLDEARALADRLLALAGQSPDSEPMLQAHHARWSTLFTLGDFHGTDGHAREGLALCPEATPDSLEYGSHDTGICARMFRARTLAVTGQPDAAAALCGEALERARELDHPFTLAFALVHAAAVHQTRRDASAARACAAEAQQVAHERSFGLMLAWAACFLGWSMAQLGEPGEGVRLLGDGVALARASGSELFLPHMLGLCASGQAAAGLVTEARQTLDDAFAISERTGEQFYAAELHRLKGDLELACSNGIASRRQAERDFLTAMRVAEGQGASQFALRSAVSLARLWMREDRSEEARRLVSEARRRLREGAELPDVVEAEALLAAIGTT
jgi:DNA-binding winged helix-turn-helix (wHTH) protein/tetratricopeptide (TPR) repeat protein